jgi:hypothetical protein
MICYLCHLPIAAQDEIEYHHPIYKSEGGTDVAPTHKRCHRQHHSSQGDFVTWGKMSALTRAWAFNLKHVKDNPAFNFDRAYYLANYAH